MRLGYVILYVADVQATVHFYERAFGLSCRFIHESGAYAEMETGATALAFVDETMLSHPFRKNRIKVDPAGIEVALVTETVEEAFNHAVKAGAIQVLRPEMKPWGQTVSYVQDNNGCLVEICSPIRN
jgi:lactoylglutathione lyase